MMTRQQILDLFRSLSMSQGFYGRLLEHMTEDAGYAENVFLYLEGQNCRDAVDVVIALEG